MKCLNLIIMAIATAIHAKPVDVEHGSALVKRDTEIIYLADCPIDGFNTGTSEIIVKPPRKYHS